MQTRFTASVHADATYKFQEAYRSFFVLTVLIYAALLSLNEL